MREKYTLSEDVIFDPKEHTITSLEQVLNLDSRVSALLLYLCRHANEFNSNQQILDEVWAGKVVTTASVSKGISKLRKDLAEFELDDLLLNRSKLGYQFCLPKQKETAKNTNKWLWIVIIALVTVVISVGGYHLYREHTKNEDINPYKINLIIDKKLFKQRNGLAIASSIYFSSQFMSYKLDESRNVLGAYTVEYKLEDENVHFRIIDNSNDEIKEERFYDVNGDSTLLVNNTVADLLRFFNPTKENDYDRYIHKNREELTVIQKYLLDGESYFIDYLTGVTEVDAFQKGLIQTVEEMKQEDINHPLFWFIYLNNVNHMYALGDVSVDEVKELTSLITNKLNEKVKFPYYERYYSAVEAMTLFYNGKYDQSLELLLNDYSPNRLQVTLVLIGKLLQYKGRNTEAKFYYRKAFDKYSDEQAEKIAVIYQSLFFKSEIIR
ncbi:winged helix-turn-helix domain-containing protein [Vibrio sp. SS-MA-C1-2]|uniref:winged helix-turn-helix domain-containing protein n=1 Tax=Vibrio sp. SS-MA-C1-2 TaxID=2908646 RepID=UPI001F48D3C2|nr:winged helix-turn-helix domain-containing protein [Vibrio sp. SS-MA-C1-2]UJF17980.1 winged helix-turn-helix domain-containing protein [Vibrio sp. SS-MA-C1-2]